MPSLSQLQDALIKADQAGDTASAQLFADEIKRMKGAQMPATGEAPSGWVRGIMDPINALSQMAEAALPKSVSNKINQFNNWLVDKGLPLDRMPEGGFDQWYREGEKKYQDARAAAGEVGIDWDRLGGNLISPANLLAASRVPQAATLLGRIGTGIAAGAGFGALQPVAEGELGEEKLKQIAFGGVTGGALPLVTGAASRVIKPKSSEAVQKLIKEGVTPTPGQALGGVFKTTEEKLTSLPIVGDAIVAGQRRTVKDFNRAVLNRALKPIGMKLDKAMEPGKEALSFVDDAISGQYEKLLPKLKGKIDSQFTRKIDSLKTAVKSMPADKYDQFERILTYDVYDRFTKQGLATGSTLKEVESKLGQLIKGYKRSPNYDDRRLGDAVREVQSQIRLMINRQNPKHKGQLKKINQAYTQFKRAERAHSYVGADDLFTPAQYHSAVKAADISKDKRLFSQGKAIGQDISTAGKEALTSRIPDSGTAGRALINLGFLGYGAINPAHIAPALAGASLYTPLGQKAALGLLAQRPGYAGPLAGGVRQSYPYLMPGIMAQENQ